MAGGFQRYQIQLPIDGAFSGIQSFSQQVLLELPFAALESMTFQRESIDAPIVEASAALCSFSRADPSGGVSSAGCGKMKYRSRVGRCSSWRWSALLYLTVFGVAPKRSASVVEPIDLRAPVHARLRRGQSEPIDILELKPRGVPLMQRRPIRKRYVDSSAKAR